MSMTYNGVEFFTDDEDSADHTAFRLLDTVSLGDVVFPHGFFIAEEDGKKYVVPATPEQRVGMLAKAFPDRPRDAWEDTCRNGFGNRCRGECHGIGVFCLRGFDSEFIQFACACIRVE